MQGALRHSVGIGERTLWRLAFEVIIEASRSLIVERGVVQLLNNENICYHYKGFSSIPNECLSLYSV